MLRLILGIESHSFLFIGNVSFITLLTINPLYDWYSLGVTIETIVS